MESWIIDQTPPNIGLIVAVQGGYQRRAIMMEYNSNFELDEAKSILPPKDGQRRTKTKTKDLRQRLLT